ncbi:hypothetical protein NU688_32745 [Variovorax sp. ZS18.2.2]|uniref:hypothetical protein n=1 Tax=Variovorax sp. ZS18.2.2 TaxID=2971255 RepID=UPI00215171E0|nr:hypothetical protein [Variovorax sp. ZS18.2.2]MCR6480965.1 hypothetical protein [Variovorax sp. ZS18.2.2]
MAVPLLSPRPSALPLGPDPSSVVGAHGVNSAHGAASDDDFGHGLSLQDHDKAIRHLTERGFIPYHPVIAAVVGHKAAVFLGLAYYWTRLSAKREPVHQGWFYMPARTWHKSTTLTTREQVTAREILVREGLLEEVLSGRPAVLHFRVNLRNTLRILGHATGDGGVAAPMPTWETLAQHLSYCIVFYKPLADVAGSAAGGLYLSYLLREQRRAVAMKRLRGGNLHISQDVVGRDLQLGPKVQRNARERMKRAGLIRESGATLLRLNLQAILACLREQDIKPLRPKGRKQASLVAAPAAIGGGTAPAALAPMRGLSSTRPDHEHEAAPSRLFQGRQLPLMLVAVTQGGAKEDAASKRESRESSPRSGVTLLFRQLAISGLSAKPISASSSTATTAVTGRFLASKVGALGPGATLGPNVGPLRLAPASELRGIARPEAQGPRPASSRPKRGDTASAAPKAPDVDLKSLVFPARLDPLLISGVVRVLGKVAVDQRQRLLDELDGHLLIQGKTIANPAGWLVGLIRAQSSGAAVFALADRVAAERAQRDEVAARVRDAGGGFASSPTFLDTESVDPETVARHRARLAALRSEFASRGGSRS